MTVIWKMRWVCPYLPRTSNFCIQKLCEVICHAIPVILVSHICVKFARGNIVKCSCSDFVICQFSQWVVLSDNYQKNVWDFHSRSYFFATLAVGWNIIFSNSTLGKYDFTILGWVLAGAKRVKWVKYWKLYHVIVPPPQSNCKYLKAKRLYKVYFLTILLV